MNKYKLDVAAIVVVYTVANMFLLLNFNAIYWDDWAWFNQDDLSYVTQAIDQLKLGYKGDFFLFLMGLDFLGGFPFRVFVFLAVLISGLSLYCVLLHIRHIDRASRFYLVLLFLLAPMYYSKMLPSIAHFFLPVMFFYLGFVFLAKYTKNSSLIYRVAALILFVLSFSTNSILVFYFIVFIFLFYTEYSFRDDMGTILKNFISMLKKFPDFLIAPFLYYIYKSIYMVPYGLYEGYNSISIGGLINPIGYLKTFSHSFVEPVLHSLLAVAPLFFVVVLFVFFMDRALQRTNCNFYIPNNKSICGINSLLLGLVLFIFGAAPYLAVGKIPEAGMSSRFQVLLPLGFSFILFSFVMYFFNEKIRVVVLNFFVVALISLGINDQIHWNVDWQYQQSILTNFKDEDIIKNNSTFVVVNNLGNKLHGGRDQSFYELNGISKAAFTSDSKIFVNNLSEIDSIKKFKDYKQYNFSSWVESEPVTLIINDALNENVNGGKLAKLSFFIKLKYLELFNYDLYSSEVKKLVSIKHLITI